MTPERLAEISRFAEAYKGTGTVRRRPNSAIAHRTELLAEVQRLTDELDCAGWSSDRSWSREIDLVQENARLTALVAQIRADAASGSGVSMHHVVTLIDTSAKESAS